MTTSDTNSSPASPARPATAPGTRRPAVDAAAFAGLRRRWREAADRFLRMYDPEDREAPRFRAMQLQTVVRLTPFAMLINLFNTAALLWLLMPQGSQRFLAIWAAAVATLAIATLQAWRRLARRPPRITASPRTMRRWVHRSIAAGVLWVAMPVVVFPELDTEGQFLVGMVVCGMISAGGFVLSSVPAAATAYTLVLGAGGLAALWRWDAPMANGVSVMLVVYCLVVVMSIRTYARTLGGRLVAEAHADRQNEVIGLLLRDFEEHASDLLWETDARGRFVHVAPRLAEVLRVPAERLRRIRATTLLGRLAGGDEEARRHWAALQAAIGTRAAFRDQAVRTASPQGHRWWSVSARPLVDERGRLQGWRGVASDITDKQNAHTRLSWLAHNDALTGLVNRTQFRELLASWLDDARAGGPPLAVLVLDLDGFKQVNDTRGHVAGDRLLQAFGDRLLAVARRIDTVARLGGDEFAIVVRGARGADDVRPLLERLLAALAAPARVFDQSVSLRASIGVAFAPADGTDVDTLMIHADIAMYAAKRQGGHRWCLFDSSLAEVTRRRSALAQDLRGAVERGELRLEFQPQVTAGDQRVVGFEALLRWRHPAHGDVPPGEFIAIAESAGLMVGIGAWVLDEACREAARWPQPLRVSINVSATQLGAPGFVEHVAAAAAAARLPAARVELEITESALADDVPDAQRTLMALRALGYRIALDDFGTGYSALGYLRRFPFDTLKIDRSFVTDLTRDAEAQVIVDTILAMSRALRMATVAEGVESPEEARMLRERGCAMLQGYLVSRPLAPSAITAFLEHWRPRATVDEAPHAA